MTDIILASASPRRRELLRAAGIVFSVVPSSVPERSFPGDAEKTVLANAEAKAESVASEHPGALVVGADTVISFEGAVLGKPEDAADAERMLLALSGKTHEVLTGVCVVRAEKNFRRSFAVATRVTFRKLDTAAVRAYMERVDVLDKAGAYAAQEHGEMMIEKIEGPRDNVVGLPVAPLLKVLAEGSGSCENKPEKGMGAELT